jgi:hypothetical protein
VARVVVLVAVLAVRVGGSGIGVVVAVLVAVLAVVTPPQPQPRGVKPPPHNNTAHNSAQTAQSQAALTRVKVESPVKVGRNAANASQRNQP